MRRKEIKWDYEVYDIRFDGTNAIDTGIKPFDDLDKKWELELIFQSDNTTFSTNDSILSCQELIPPYIGIIMLFRFVNDNQSSKYEGFYVECEYPAKVSYYLGNTFSSKTRCTISYKDNKLTVNSDVFYYTISHQFERNLILGASQQYNGSFYRYWKGYIYSFKFRWL